MKIKLNAQIRENGIKEKDFISAVVYGPQRQNASLKIKKNEFEKVFAAAGESTLIDLIIVDAEPVKVLIKDIQRNPLKDNISHIDFYQVDMSKEITTEIPLIFIGEAKAIKELGGMLVKSYDHIEVECLPGDLVSHIDVDISSLNNFGDHISLHDLKLPAGLKLVHETNDILATAMEPRAEEEVAVAPAEAEAAAVAASAPVAETKEEKK